MLNRRSKIEEIIDYIDKLKLLSLSKEEIEQINQILSLNKIVKSDSIRALIAEDLKDEKWLEDTQILINTCQNKVNKTEAIKRHIIESKNFIVYRFIEDKLMASPIEIQINNENLELHIIESEKSRFRWMQKKFLSYFNNSMGFDFLYEKVNNTDEKKILIDLPWLYLNGEKFFNKDIFKGIK